MKRFLVIEDEAFILDMIKASLLKIFPQASIDHACELDGAIQHLNSKKYDLIVLDGTLKDGHHGREILSIMSGENITKTAVYSGEIKFLCECQNRNMLTFSKTSSFEEVLTKINKKLSL